MVRAQPFLLTALPAVPHHGQHRPQAQGPPSQGYQMNSWLQGSAGFQDRLASSQYSQSARQPGGRPQGHGPPIDTSSYRQRQSTASATAGRSGYSAHSAGSSASSPPPLSYSPQSDSASSQWSLPTNPYSPDVDHFDDHGNVVRAAQTHYTCLFAFLGCRWHGNRSQEWRTHCNSHLWKCGAPQEFTCPHCGHHRVGRGAWEAGLDHADGHFARDRRLDQRHRDKHLCKHLWDHHVIPDATYRVLTEPAPFDSDQVTTIHDPHRHRRYR